MGKFDRKKAKKTRWVIILAVVVIGLLAVLPVLLRPSQNNPEGGSPETGTTVPIAENPSDETPAAPNPTPDSTSDSVQTAERDETAPDFEFGSTVSFPLPLGDGELMLESLFPFEGPNPDCGYQDGNDTAAVLIRNVSDRYLKSATILVILGDGSQITFSVSDLPADKEVLAFSTENAELEDDSECIAVEADAAFEEAQIPEEIVVSVQGITVTVTNESQREMRQINVFCHGAFGDRYYGGVTYGYTIEKLAPGASASIEVTECMLGMVDVARIVVN